MCTYENREINTIVWLEIRINKKYKKKRATHIRMKMRNEKARTIQTANLIGYQLGVCCVCV